MTGERAGHETGDRESAPEGAAPGQDTDADSPARGEERRPESRENFFDRLAHLVRPRMPRIMREDLSHALQEAGVGEDSFSPAERAMLNNILRLRELRVEDVMVPRADIKATEITSTLAELLKQFETSGHSRMPVYGESLDDPRGMVHIRDVVAHITRSARPARSVEASGQGGNGHAAAVGSGNGQGSNGQGSNGQAGKKPRGDLDLRQINLARRIEDLKIVRTVLFVPPSMLASDLMARMQATRTQMALVIDEYGGTDGLVSLEDIIEMVVGNIEDEHDDEAAMIRAAGEGIWIADARADLEDVRALVGEEFDISEYVQEADTIGGLLFSELGRVPARGEVVQAMPGFEFHVLDADPRRVRRVRIVGLRQGERRRRVVSGLADAS